MTKILIILSGFFPGKKYGGPPVSVDNFCALQKDCECYIVTHNHDLLETKKFDGIHEGWNDRSNCKVLYLSDLEYNKNTFEKVLIEINPDILYLQGLFQSCVLPCLLLAKKYDIPVLLAPRGELCKGAFNIRKWKKIPYIYVLKFLRLVENVHWQSTSEEEFEAIKKLMNVEEKNIFRLENIPSIPKKKYQRKEKKTGKSRFVFLSRIHPKKNLLFAISLFEGIKSNVEFDIYGSIEDDAYWKCCQGKMAELPNNVIVRYKGLVCHDQIYEVLSQYDALLLPTLSENYGHVIAESMFVGTPVIISNQTPWTDVNENNIGWAIPLDSKSLFEGAIKKIVEMDEVFFNTLSKNVLRYVSNKTKIDSIREKYREALMLIKNKKK